MTRCAREPIRFQGPGRRQGVARFDGGWMSSDGGALLLQAADRVLDERITVLPVAEIRTLAEGMTPRRSQS